MERGMVTVSELFLSTLNERKEPTKTYLRYLRKESDGQRKTKAKGSNTNQRLNGKMESRPRHNKPSPVKETNVNLVLWFAIRVHLLHPYKSSFPFCFTEEWADNINSSFV